MRRGGKAPGSAKSDARAGAGAGIAFCCLYEISKIKACRKFPDIYSFVTMGMIMGLRLVVL